MKKKKIVFNIMGILILIGAYTLPEPEGLSSDGMMMMGILVYAAFMWITRPIPIAATGLLILVLPAALGIVDSSEALSYFGNKAVFFLLGAFIITAALEKHHVHKRFSLHILRRIGKSPIIFSLGIFCISAFSSFIMPEHAVAALMIPIVLSILVASKVTPKKSNFAKLCMLSVAFGCSLGSLGTLVGGARNPVTISFLEETSNIRLSFFDWMYYSVPVVLVTLPIIWFILIKVFRPEIGSLVSARGRIDQEVKNMGRINQESVIILVILFMTIMGWIFLHYQLGPAVIAVLGGILLFATGVITWEDVEKRVPWGIILLYGGAIALGVNLQKTGAANFIAVKSLSMLGSNPYVILLSLIILTILLTSFMSNTAAVGLLLPVGLGISNEIPELGPVVTSMIIALSGGLAFILVIATPGNAITYSTGYYRTKDLFKAGSIVTIISILILFLIAISYWKLIGLW